MGNEEKTVGYIIAFLVAVFVVTTLLYGVGVLTPDNEAEGFLVNLQYGVERWFDNPTLIALLITVFINAWGFIENVAGGGDEESEYYVTKFFETFAVYEPMLILFMQALPLEWAIPLAVVIDVIRRIAKARS